MIKHERIKTSPHFNEIHERLCKGDSPYSVNKWMVNSFKKEEVISVSTLRRYQNDLGMEQKVTIQMNEIAAKEKEIVKDRATKKIQTENTTNHVVEETAKNMMGVMKVANELPAVFKKAKNEAYDPEHRTTFKDLVQLSLQANKILNDFFKNNESEVSININNNLSDMFCENDILRFINESETNE